jgi:hypothetical protein
LEDANLDEWTIKGAICNYIRSGSEKEITRYHEGEFEKRFSFFKETVELVLKIPFSISAVCVGKLIAQSTNAVLDSEVICLKGVEALAQDSTRLSFFILDRDFYEGKTKFFERGLFQRESSQRRTHVRELSPRGGMERGVCPKGTRGKGDLRSEIRRGSEQRPRRGLVPRIG